MWAISEVFQLQTALLLCIVGAVSDKITISPTLPEMNQLAKISCFSTEDRTLTLNGIHLATCNKITCIPIKDHTRGYYYTADNYKAEVAISSLDRARDGGLWTCFARGNSSINLDIYTFPRGLSFTKGGDTEGDLAESEVLLQCQTDGCTYPTPSIKWYYKNQKPLGPRMLYKEMGTQENKTDENCTFPENKYISSLHLPLYTTWSDNSDKTVTFSCGIEYSNSSRNVYSLQSKSIKFSVAVFHVELQQDRQPLLDTFRLNVTSGKPVILTCFHGISRPEPTIEWYIGADQRSTGTSQKFTFYPKEKDHDKTIYCRAFSVDPSSAVESGKAILYVRVQVIEVTLERNSLPVQDRSFLPVIADEIVTLTCVPGASRPEPIIEWYIGSQMRRSATSQNFTFTPGNEDHDKAVYCRAYNVDPSEAVQSSKPKLYVKVAVESVNVSVPTPTLVFYEGFPQSLNCTSSPSRPIPTIRWWLDSAQLTDTIITTNIKDVSGLYTLTSHISLALWKDDMNRQIYCDGFVDGQRVVSSSRHSVDVLYEPSKPKVMEYGGPHSWFPWFENTTGILQCNSSDYGHPNSIVIWNSHRGVSDSEDHLIILDLAPKDNEKEVSCKLENRFTIDKNVHVVSEFVKLDVEYNPMVNYNASDPLTAHETHSVYVMCEVNGNPRPDTVRWRDREYGNLLRFDNISRHDAGTYTCEATAYSTKYGTLISQRQLHIVVQYAPDITVKITSSTLQNETVVLVCEACGVPAENTFSPWVHMWGDAVIRTGLQGTVNLTHNTLIVDRLSLEEMGTYVCSATNGIIGVNGKLKQTGSENLHVSGEPSILNENYMFAGEMGMSLNVSIPFYSDPAIESFIIKRKGKLLANTTSINTYVSKAAVDIQMYGTTVKFWAQRAYTVIRNLTKEDFNNYTLVLQNAIDTTEYTFQLVEFGPPWSIRRFYFNKFIGDQTEFLFDPGFSGGPDQSFVIEYKSALGTNSTWQNTTVKDLQERESQYRHSNGTFTVNVTQSSPGLYLYRMYSWNVKGKSPFSDSILITIPSQTEEENIMDDQLLVTMPVVVGVGAGGAVLVAIIIALVIVVVILKKRSSPDKPPHGNTSEVPGYEIISGVVPTGWNNAMSGDYESQGNNMEEENPYIELQEHSQANRETESRSEVGRKILQSAENHESPRSSQSEVHSYLEVHDLTSECRVEASAGSDDGRKITESAGNYDISHEHDCLEITSAEIHSYLEPQDLTSECRLEATARSMDDTMHHSLDAGANQDHSTTAGGGSS